MSNKLKELRLHDEVPRVEHRAKVDHTSLDQLITRRGFNVRLLLLTMLISLGILKPTDALAKEVAEGEGKNVEELLETPIGLEILDVVGSANFADCIVSMAREKDSVVQMLIGKLMSFFENENTKNEKDSHADKNNNHDHEDHQKKFPGANLAFGLILNAFRAACFSKEVSHETKHELKTTFVGVGLLFGLTSLGKSIVAVETKSEDTGIMQMASESPELMKHDPEAELGKSIFQLTAVAAGSQLPLLAFGNAAIGKGEFETVKKAYTVLYGKYPHEMASLITGRSKRLLEGTKPIADPSIRKTLQDHINKAKKIQAELPMWQGLSKNRTSIEVRLNSEENGLTPEVAKKLKELLGQNKDNDTFQKAMAEKIKIMENILKSLQHAIIDSKEFEPAREAYKTLYDDQNLTTIEDAVKLFEETSGITNPEIRENIEVHVKKTKDAEALFKALDEIPKDRLAVEKMVKIKEKKWLPGMKQLLKELLKGSKDNASFMQALEAKKVTIKNEVEDLQQEELKGFPTYAKNQTNDVMTLLMSTACDDAQAAAGDAGPLVGLYQSAGPDFLKVIPMIFPYTIAIGLERSISGAERAGIPVNKVINKENLKYLLNFLLATWKNLILYFVQIAPKIVYRIAGHEYSPMEAAGGGRDFTVVEQIFSDLKNTITTVMAPFYTLESYTAADIRQAIKEIQAQNTDFEAMIGKMVIKKAKKKADEKTEGAQINIEAMIGKEVLENINKAAPTEEGKITETPESEKIGESIYRKVPDDAPTQFTEEDLELLKKQNLGDFSNSNLKETVEQLEKLALNGKTKKAINEFANHLNEMKETIMPDIEKEVKQLMKTQGRKPTIETIAKLLSKNPRIRDLADINYWEHRIGSELTDTIFVVFLQGIHLVFIINTVERFVYEGEWFKSLPLKAQEVVSMALNEGISMFADNWADAVAHCKWATRMFFNDLEGYLDQLENEYPEDMKEIIPNRKKFFEDDTNELIPKRYEKNRGKFTEVIIELIRKHPEDRSKLEEMLGGYFIKSEKYYWKTLSMSMIAAVTGGGKALTGNAPHFTFAAGQQDFKLMDTLKDFKRHPVYHLWEFCFGTVYATALGPALGQTMFGGDMVAKSQQVLQEKFRASFPDFEEKMAELEAKERETKKVGQKKISRRGFGITV